MALRRQDWKYLQIVTLKSLRAFFVAVQAIIQELEQCLYAMISNKNNQSYQLGKDAYLQFSCYPKNWKHKNTEQKIKNLFKGSISDGSEGSIYYEVQIDDKNKISGNITLPKERDDKKLSGGAVAGIVIGLIFLIGSVVAIGIVVMIAVRRKNLLQINNSGQESQLLIAHKHEQYT
ncbi:MAG: hypothetical protein EZS28_004990 [Streblomastix strix]|uniref:Uncharacterized protein n=1 Tax=Streblomastix strix TaxID=222440 RepID=A0A5J4WYR1_9EUKA|nr:MAG: hypothetical protein EZS28_004990 [Streblomastix strix]